MTTKFFPEHEINILIVDDNKDILNTLQMSLEQDRRKIFTTTNPHEVLKICIEESISIILLDVVMPEISGLELLDTLKKDPLTNHIPVILITGQILSSADAVTGLSKGAVDFLSKPLDLYITQAKINSLIMLLNYQQAIQHQNKELEKSQEQLSLAMKRAEKTKVLKENFLANMSHEIRTPLTAITGLTHLLKDAENADDRSNVIQLLEYSTQSLLGLVNDILDSEKIDAGKISISRSNTDIKMLVKNCGDLLRPLASKKGLQLNCYIDDAVPSAVMTDPLRFNQILMNLINNAIKFTEVGQVDVKVKVEEVKEQKVLLKVAIRDTGMGIPEASKSKIFDRFTQVEDHRWQKFGGTGLGLSIVKKLIELKGGILSVDSAVGKGTTITFSNWYEVCMENNAACADAAAPVLSNFKNVCVLLAEDDAINQMVTTRILNAWDIKVDVAVNGEEAFKKAREKVYDLILMDTHMPLMNGYEATRKIRTELAGKKSEIPIISFSASVMEKDQEKAMEAGMNSLVTKPFNLADLHEKISASLVLKKGYYEEVI